MKIIKLLLKYHQFHKTHMQIIHINFFNSFLSLVNFLSHKCSLSSVTKLFRFVCVFFWWSSSTKLVIFRNFNFIFFAKLFFSFLFFIFNSFRNLFLSEALLWTEEITELLWTPSSLWDPSKSYYFSELFSSSIFSSLSMQISISIIDYFD